MLVGVRVFSSGCIVCGMLSVGVCPCIQDPPPEHMIVNTGDCVGMNCIASGLHKWQLNEQRPQLLPEYDPRLSDSDQNYTLSLCFPRNEEVVVKCVCKPDDQDLEECSATTKVIVLGIYLCTIMLISESEWST